MSDERQVQMISVHKIDFHDANVRKELRNTDELAVSIGVVGVLHPLTIIRNGGGYLVADGHRRLKAARVAGLEEIPCIVHEGLEGTELIEHMAVANLQREDLTSIEEAQAYKTLVDAGRSQRDIADLVGVSQSHVSKRVELLELPDDVQIDILEGGTTLEEAQQLGRLKEHPARLRHAMEEARQHGYKSIKTSVEDELRALGTERKKAEAVERLEKSKTRIVDQEQVYDRDATNQWAVLEDLGLEAGSHVLDPCHAAFVDNRTGDVVHVCTDPTAHEEGGTSNLKRPQPEEDDRGFDATGLSDENKRQRSKSRDDAQRHRQDLEKADERRAAHIRDHILSKRVAKTEILDFLVRACIHESVEMSAAEDLVAVCNRLGLVIAESDNWSEGAAAHKVLQEYLLDHPDRLPTVGLAIAIERFDSQTYGTGITPRHGVYFQFLSGHGYEISKAEKKALEGPKAASETDEQIDPQDDKTVLSPVEVAAQLGGEVIQEVTGSVARPVGAAAQ